MHIRESKIYIREIFCQWSALSGIIRSSICPSSMELQDRSCPPGRLTKNNVDSQFITGSIKSRLSLTLPNICSSWLSVYQVHRVQFSLCYEWTRMRTSSYCHLLIKIPRCLLLYSPCQCCPHKPWIICSSSWSKLDSCKFFLDVGKRNYKLQGNVRMKLFF